MFRRRFLSTKSFQLIIRSFISSHLPFPMSHAIVSLFSHYTVFISMCCVSPVVCSLIVCRPAVDFVFASVILGVICYRSLFFFFFSFSLSQFLILLPTACFLHNTTLLCSAKTKCTVSMCCVPYPTYTYSHSSSSFLHSPVVSLFACFVPSYPSVSFSLIRFSFFFSFACLCVLMFDSDAHLSFCLPASDPNRACLIIAQRDDRGTGRVDSAGAASVSLTRTGRRLRRRWWWWWWW